jgi:peroxiredoxin
MAKGKKTTPAAAPATAAALAAASAGPAFGRIYLAGIGIVLAALGYIFADTLRERVVNQGDQAAPFSVKASDGQTYSVNDFKGRVLVLNFWASWCQPCVEEMPSLNRFAQEMKGKGVTVLGISIDHDEAKYEKFVKAVNLKFPVYRDDQGSIPASYGTFKVPETYIIDRNGRVVEKIIGEKMWMDPSVLSNIQRYL